MSIREKIGKCPAWKAVVIVLLGIFFMLAGIEEFFFSRIINIINHRITQFEKLFKEDDKDLEKDTHHFREQFEYDQADYNLTAFMLNKNYLDTHQNEY